MKVLAVLLSVLLAAPVWAKTPCTTQSYDSGKEPRYDCPGPGEAALTPTLKMRDSVGLTTGKKAPWEGVLLDRNRVITLGLKIKAVRRLRYLDMLERNDRVDAELKLAKANAAANLKLRTSQRDTYKSQVRVLRGELKEAKKWWRSWTFGFVLGLAVTAAGTTALAYSLRK